MPESSRITNRERDVLENQLRSAVWPASQKLRDRLLYACGVAVGRQDARRRTYRWTAAAAALGIFAGSLAAGGLGSRSTPGATGNMTRAQGRGSEMISANWHVHTSGAGSTPIDNVGRFPLAASARTMPDQLTSGSRFDQALALIDGADLAFESGGGPQSIPDRPPLRPVSGFLQ